MKFGPAFALILMLSMNAMAQPWPTKPVRVIVTFAPGGSSDIVARLVAIPLQAELGQSIIVDNKPGAGGTIGAQEAAAAPPDGYTLLLSNSAPISISPAMQDQPRYDPLKAFTHAAYIGSVANVFVVHPSVPAKNMGELIAWIKAEKNPVNYGSGGIGSIGHLLGETMKKDFGLRMEHVGYKGSSPMHNDLLSGTIKLAIDTLPQNVPFIKDGKLRALRSPRPPARRWRPTCRACRSSDRRSWWRKTSSAFPDPPACRARWSRAFTRPTRRRSRIRRSRSASPSSACRAAT